MDYTILEDLGLTEAEIKVYLALLELGSHTAGAVLAKSSLQNSVVHRALNSLIEKGLINYVNEGKRRVYQATDPTTFYSFMEEKKRRFDSLLPELKKRQQHVEQAEKATVYKGIRGMKEVYNIMIKSKGEYNTFGGGTPCEKLMGSAWWLNLHQRRIAHKLSSRQVFDASVHALGAMIDALPRSKVKFLSRDFQQFQETVIVGSKVSINVFTEHPYSFVIDDITVANGYRKYFEVLWKKAKN